jgi:hypothetical protein
MICYHILIRTNIACRRSKYQILTLVLGLLSTPKRACPVGAPHYKDVSHRGLTLGDVWPEIGVWTDVAAFRMSEIRLQHVYLT